MTIEAQVTRDESVGGIQITVVEPKPGVFPEQAPVRDRVSSAVASYAMVCESSAMGLGVGGLMTQKIYPDKHGFGTWDAASAATTHIHLVSPRDWRLITGESAPPSPISVEQYDQLGLPSFALADSEIRDLPVSPVSGRVKPIVFE